MKSLPPVIIRRGTIHGQYSFPIRPDRAGEAVAVVLIVENDAQVRIMAESILQGGGYETRSAGTLTEAQAIIESDSSCADLALFRLPTDPTG